MRGHQHKELNRERELRVFELAHAPLQTWYLSFAKDKKDGGWQGGVFVMAHGMVTALDRVNALGINPGGSVMALPAPHTVFPELLDRLLSMEQMEAAFGELVKGTPEDSYTVCPHCNEIHGPEKTH